LVTVAKIGDIVVDFLREFAAIFKKASRRKCLMRKNQRSKNSTVAGFVNSVGTQQKGTVEREIFENFTRNLHKPNKGIRSKGVILPSFRMIPVPKIKHQIFVNHFVVCFLSRRKILQHEAEIFVWPPEREDSNRCRLSPVSK
jgi:hypothetical protein